MVCILQELIPIWTNVTWVKTKSNVCYVSEIQIGKNLSYGLSQNWCVYISGIKSYLSIYMYVLCSINYLSKICNHLGHPEIVFWGWLLMHLYLELTNMLFKCEEYVNLYEACDCILIQLEAIGIIQLFTSSKFNDYDHHVAYFSLEHLTSNP